MSEVNEVIAVYLPGTTQYVTGTVNGVTVVWTNVAERLWQTIADRRPDGIYELQLTLVSMSGVTSTVGLTVYASMNLITDRTLQDVYRWKELKAKGYANMTASERAEWASCKGAYNYTDLNRVEAAVRVIAEKLNALHIPVTVTTKSDWTNKDLPTRSDMDRYLGNVLQLRNSSSGLRLAPQPPSTMEKLDYIGANDIEKTLLYINSWADGMKDAQKYSGEIFGGEI